MTEIRIQKFTFIRLIYGIIIIIILISAFLPYYSEFHHPFPTPPEDPIYVGYFTYYMGYVALIFGGWVGFALGIISIILMSPERKRKALLFGGTGFLLIIISLMIYPSIISSNQVSPNPITFASGFYLCLIFGIGSVGTNIFAFVSKEGELRFQRVKSSKIKEEKVKPEKLKQAKAKPMKRKTVEIEPIEIKQEVLVGTDWEKKEFIADKTIDYIKTMQFKTKELPFFDIISKMGIKREALETIVDDMISNNEIDARVRDFVIIFKEISKEKREEGLKKIKNSLQQKMSDIDNLIKENRFDEGIATLNEVIEAAESFQLKDFVNKAKEKIDLCNKLKIEKREEIEEQRIKDELRTQISDIEDLIEDNKFKIAHRNLDKVKEIAQEYNLLDFLNEVEELKNQCNALESDIRRDMEESKVKSEIQQKILAVTKLIDQKKFDVAISNLERVIEDAGTFELKEFVKEAEEKIKICKELEIEWRRDQKQKAKENLKTKMSEISILIKESKIKNALKQLDAVKEIAQEYEFSEFLKEADKKVKECQALEQEIRKDKEQIKIEKKLHKKLSKVENLVESNQFYDAILNLVDIKEVARQYELPDLLEKIEEKIDYCKNFQFNIKNKIKNTILNYGSKLARLELMDISEKSGIQDENLIEKIILEMINNREINAEYFSSSKSIAFYQQGKESTPIADLGKLNKQRVFLSYSTLDAEHFQISNIVKELEVYPEIKKVSYWQADSKQNIVEFMEDTLKNTDVFVLFCSKNSVKSNAVKDEWQAAFQMRKKGMVKIIPVFEDEDDIPVLLWQMLNVKFAKDDFNGFIEKLYEEILRGLQKQVSPTA